MSGLYFKDSKQMKEAQKDLLWSQRTDANDTLVYDSRIAVNEKLMTNNKRIIGSINEIHTRYDGIRKTVEKSLTDVSTVIGDVFTTSSEDKTKFDELGGSIVEVVHELKEQVGNQDSQHIDGGTF